MHTLVTVAYANAPLVLANIAHTQRLHPTQAIQWFIADNTPLHMSGGLLGHPDCPPNVTVLAGVLPDDCCPPQGFAFAAGSYHHATALNVLMATLHGMPNVPRYLTIIDPDFYLLQPHLLDHVVQTMATHQLAALGTPWNPVYTGKYRGLPCVHFLTIDTQALPPSLLDFRPGYGEKPLRDSLQQHQYKGYGPLVKRLKRWDKGLNGCLLGTRRGIGTSLDTGCRVALTLVEKDLPFGLLTPVFQPTDLPKAMTTRVAKWLDACLPPPLRLQPPQGTYCAEAQFVIEGAETFVWRGNSTTGQQASLFGVHLRGVQRTLGQSFTYPQEVLAQLENWMANTPTTVSQPLLP
jgi:hypothetical protein